MKLAWFNRATTDRLAIFVWIAEDNPQAAADLDERIEAAAQRIVIRMTGVAYRLFVAQHRRAQLGPVADWRL